MEESVGCQSKSVNRTTSASLCPSYQERTLPSTSVGSAAKDLPVSAPGTIPWEQSKPSPPLSPSWPVSRTSSTTRSPCNSPSIANLDRLSVVKQRLAQLECHSSHSSVSGLTSPQWLSRCPRNSLNTPSIYQEDSSPNGLHLTHSKDMPSSVVDLIPDSYDMVNLHPDHSNKSVPSMKSSVVMYQQDLSSSQTPANSGYHPSNVVPGFELVKDCTLKSCCHQQILVNKFSLRQHIQDLTQEMASIIGSEANNNMCEMVSRLHRKSEAHEELLKSIEVKTSTAEEHWKICGASASGDPNFPQALQSMRRQLATDLPAVLTKLDQIQGLFPSLILEHSCIAPLAADLSGLHVKLNDLLGVSDTAKGQLAEVSRIHGDNY